MKLYYLLFIIFNINFIHGYLKEEQVTSCTSYINIQSSITQSPCGDSLANACQTFILANQTCNIQSFTNVTYYFSPGTYSFSNIDPFGTIVNKNIQILNQDYSTTTSSSNVYTSVIFNLEDSLNSFFNINYNNYSSDITNINVNGITFINGFQNTTSSILLNNGTGSYSFTNCVFENNLSGLTNGGSILFVKTIASPVILSNLSISNCIYQNTNSSLIDGGFICISGTKVNVNIDSSTFINSFVSTGSIIIHKSFDSNSSVSITNSNFNKNTITKWNAAAVEINCLALLSNITFQNNTGGGNGFGLYGRNPQVLKSKFINNLNTTAIAYSNSNGNGLLVDSCYFSQNNNYQSVGYGEGGCITISNSFGTIRNNQFINNYAITGSALYISSTIGGIAQIINNTFDSNSANQGCIYTLYSTISFNSTNTFTNNYGVSGSAIYCTNSDLYIGNSSIMSFKNNTDSKDNSPNGVTCGSVSYTNECTVYGKNNICNATDSSSSSSKDNSESSSKDNSSTHNSSDSNDNSSTHNNSSSKDNSSTHNNSSSKDNSSSSHNNSSGSKENNKKNKLSTGDKAAIAVSVIFGVIGLVILAIFILRRNKLRKGYIPIQN